MKVKMKQNKNSFVIRVASATLSVFVLFFSLCVPSFAEESVPSFDDQPIPNTGTSQYREDNYENSTFDVGSESYGNYRVFASTNSLDVYAVGIGSSSPYAIYFLTDNTSTNQYAGIAGKYNGGGGYIGSSSQQSLQLSTIDNVTNYRYIPTGTSVAVCNVPVFNDIASACLGLQEYLNSGGLGASSPLSTSLPAGNAIIIDISGNSGEVLSLSSTSALRHRSPWSDGNQTMNYTDIAPSSISTPYGSTISWTGSGSPNLFGGYNTWILNGPLNPSKSYLVIVNPAYPNDNPDSITSNQASNGPIHISCAFCNGYTFVPLSSYWNNGSISNESGSVRLDGEYDESTQSWVTTNPATGEPQNPVSGGMTDVDAEHVTINDWLQNISHQIGSFFSGAIGAVSNLVSAGSDFIHSVSGLYAWLPAPVYSVLTSALILIITIGVIKVFI